MSNISAEETKAVYEISKLTSPTKQIMDDFTASVVMAMFKDYIVSFDNPSKALSNFMLSWEDNIIEQKIDELTVLSSQQDSLSDMVVGQKISEEEDLDEFKSNVEYVSDMIKTSIHRSLR